MKIQSKFFSKGLTKVGALFVLFLLPACSSTPARESETDDQLLKSRQVQKIYKGVLFDAYVHDQAVIRAVEHAKDDPSEAVLRAYCAEGKQVRDLSYQLKIIPPSAPKGIPVDRAAKIAANASSRLEWVAKNFFRTMERPEMDPKDPDLAFQRDNATVGGGGLKGLPEKARAIPASDEIRYSRLAEEGPAIDYVFISLGGDKILATDRRILGDGQRYGSYAVESEQSLRSRPMQVDLARALPGEWAYLNQLVLLPSRKEFRAWIAYRDRLQETDPSEAYIGPEHADALYDEGGRVVIEEAMSKASSVWNLYVLRYASSKSAVQEDGSTVIQVSLDLGGVCSYARSRRMLLSK